jgi:hypothetical protein
MSKKIDNKKGKEDKINNNITDMKSNRRGRRPQDIEETDENPLNKKDVKKEKISSVIVNIKAKMKNVKEEEEEDEKQKDVDSDDIFIDTTNNNCKHCIEYQKEIDILKNKKQVNMVNYLEERQSEITYSNLKMATLDGNKLNVKLKTDLWCMHDCHPFKTIPCYLVEKYYDGIYYVFGNFCCVSCALAYNVYFIKDTKMSERERLTIAFYKHMFNPNVKFKHASPREILIPFGGKQTIEEFRKDILLMNKEYMHLIPPCSSIVSQIETTTIKHEEKVDKKKKK